jgi:hypothetical protein
MMAVSHLALRAAVFMALAAAVSAVVSLDEPFSNTTSDVFSLYPQLALNGGPCTFRPSAANSYDVCSQALVDAARFAPENERALSVRL